MKRTTYFSSNAWGSCCENDPVWKLQSPVLHVVHTASCTLDNDHYLQESSCGRKDIACNHMDKEENLCLSNQDLHSISDMLMEQMQIQRSYNGDLNSWGNCSVLADLGDLEDDKHHLVSRLDDSLVHGNPLDPL